MLSDISVRSALAMFVNNSVFSDQAGVVNGYAFSVQEIMRYVFCLIKLLSVSKDTTPLVLSNTHKWPVIISRRGGGGRHLERGTKILPTQRKGKRK